MILFLARRRLTSFLSFLLQVSVVKCMSVQCYSLIQVEIKLRERRLGAFWCLSLLCSPSLSRNLLRKSPVPHGPSVCGLELFTPGANTQRLYAQWGFAFTFFCKVVAGPLVGKGDVGKGTMGHATSVLFSKPVSWEDTWEFRIWTLILFKQSLPVKPSKVCVCVCVCVCVHTYPS